jgi:putative DNA primase/helicase
LNLLLFVLSTALSGRAIEKFFVFNGAGRNGKGFLNEFMKVLLGDYFEYVSPIILTEDPKKKSSAQASPEMAKLSKMRYVVCKEPPKNQPIHNNVMKDLTGGGEVQARM